MCRSSNTKINFREKEKEVLDQILGPGRYDARIRPSGVNGTGEICLFFTSSVVIRLGRSVLELKTL